MLRSLWLDVDGTVVDTRELNRTAYAEIGVEYPDDAWGNRWEHWLPRVTGYPLEACEVLHRAKMEVYLTLISKTDLRELLLPPGRLAYAHLVRGRGPVRYLTAGSARTATVLLARLGILGRLDAELVYTARRKVLLHEATLESVYIDDRLDTIARLRQDMPGLKTVHFSGQSYERLLEDITWNRSTR